VGGGALSVESVSAEWAAAPAAAACVDGWVEGEGERRAKGVAVPPDGQSGPTFDP
jgi:hypothetical protein